MDYRKSAEQVLYHIGGKENIVSAAHCATRLRLVVADNAKMDAEALENVDGVKGVFEASGQIQIIFGTGTVNKVYEELSASPELPEVRRRRSSRRQPQSRISLPVPSRHSETYLCRSFRQLWRAAF